MTPRVLNPGAVGDPAQTPVVRVGDGAAEVLGVRERPAVFEARPVQPERIEAIRYDGNNDAEVAEFVGRAGGELIGWIDPDRWVTFNGNAEGFPVPVGFWVVRPIGGGFGDLDLAEPEEFTARYQAANPLARCAHCGRPTGGPLDDCERAECVAADMDLDKAFERGQE